MKGETVLYVNVFLPKEHGYELFLLMLCIEQISLITLNSEVASLNRFVN